MSALGIIALEAEIADLRLLLKMKESQLKMMKGKQQNETLGNLFRFHTDNLTKEEIGRFSRQIILPEIGSKGQLILRNSSVLIVGVGGLGCPAAQYLTGAGVGHIGLIDYDSVELSNLHRQLLLSEESVGVPKVTSAASSLRRLNSKQKITEYNIQLKTSNALQIISQYDVIIDATDNVATRYLLNDACILSHRPLVSGSALRLEGQLTVYGYENGPCYRCLFPKPPPPESITNCGDGGVLGVVPGVIGILEALEAMKILLKWPGVLSQWLLLFSAEDSNFHRVRLRLKSQACAACGEKPSVTELVDYEQFCGAKANDKDCQLKLLSSEQRIKAVDLHNSMISGERMLLVDVREPAEFEMCSLPRSFNFPLNSLHDPDSVSGLIRKVDASSKENTHKVYLYVVCRRGNDSQKAVLKLTQLFSGKSILIRDIEGGLHSWSRTVDHDFPIY